MGRDKSTLEVDGRTFLERTIEQLRGHFDEILLSAAADRADRYGALGLPVVLDRLEGCGPLMGIASSLAASCSDVNFVLACDIPDIDMSLVGRMLSEIEGHDAVVPMTGAGKYEPLFAVYRKSILPHMEGLIRSGRYRILNVFSRCKTKYIDIDGNRWLYNINTPADLWAYRDRHAQE